ncbi:hypothetical protein PhiCrAssBcn1_60 [Bacteroides phage PhiCrAssBcn1]|nr:hypothetical protein PhiCrAssBcn4_98 [Bacteroides phage PhiCrAssBcn4]WCF57124.1 hypothetical protein PhiCrAssBcn13_72 [Bacteroides phage PhiCrAssBcn13]WCF57285.1 hypothetical protein PhiCrAssBcn24_30 [Bacteroides phage PhiCrAssBcn24]WCF57416.1 hypothetical protein PhiCrAssBcn1_60 [Bacteroides phage PhiCrAssBcn1]WCF57491.1 hypothetical protein PhiCrAssBcn2_34 [Bacteroides phage PhiCrAssBcn2]WCF57633.1 hypothetical protein PhiCrAssBcn3_77 [Bacteroides phage PhiCrAssBcn3]WCF57735.1 hypothetic
MKTIIKLIMSILLITVACSCVKFEPIVKYTEPDETWEYTPLKLENVIEYHGSNSNRGYVYWMVYTDPDCEWYSQVISMDWDTFAVLVTILKAPEEDKESLMDEHEPTILYKQGYQPVLVLSDKD